jgi:transcriptional regulator with XRE-family HTH domain
MRAARIYVPNVQLREHRLRLNLTLEEVAEALTALAWERFAVRVGVNAGMVGKWERGEKRPSRFYQRLFVLLYGAPPEQLGFRPAGPSDQAAEDVLVELGAGEGVAQPRLDSAAPGGAGFPVPVMATPRRVDPEAVGRLGTILTEYAKSTTCWGRPTFSPSRSCTSSSSASCSPWHLARVAPSCSRSAPATPSLPAGYIKTPATPRRRPTGPTGRWAGPRPLTTTSWCPMCSCARATKRPAMAMRIEPSGWLGRPCADRIGSHPALVRWRYANRHEAMHCPAMRPNAPGA